MLTIYYFNVQTRKPQRMLLLVQMKCQSVSTATPARTLLGNLRYEFHIGTMFFLSTILLTCPSVQKVKKTPVDPHKVKTERDDAVDSFGKHFRSDSKNLPSESEVSITCLNHIANKGFISTIFLT